MDQFISNQRIAFLIPLFLNEDNSQAAALRSTFKFVLAFNTTGQL